MGTSKFNILKVVILGLLLVTACTANAFPAGPMPLPPTHAFPAGPMPLPPVTAFPAGPMPLPPVHAFPAGPMPLPPAMAFPAGPMPLPPATLSRQAQCLCRQRWLSRRAHASAPSSRVPGGPDASAAQRQLNGRITNVGPSNTLAFRRGYLVYAAPRRPPQLPRSESLVDSLYCASAFGRDAICEPGQHPLVCLYRRRSGGCRTAHLQACLPNAAGFLCVLYLGHPQ